GNGTGRRKNDVYGGRLLRLATYDIEHLPWCPVRLGDWDGVNDVAGKTQYADASAVRSFSGHWRRCCFARGPKHRRLVCGTVSMIADCQLPIAECKPANSTYKCNS